ncbi:MAG: ABC transporter ATP-binding protein [Pseudomonadota bacterium]
MGAGTGADHPRLALDAVTRRFAGELAVEELSLEIAAGEVVCLLGPSGCGKTTTLRIAAGVERQDSGAVRVAGRVMSEGARHAPPEQRAVGLIFQDLALFPHLTALENVAFGLRALAAPARRARATRELARVDLGFAADRYPHQLSGGEQQRVALARAMAPEPGVLLMDEPFASLDQRLRDAVRDQALRLLKEDGAGVLLVTHDPEEALRMADRIALMRAGRIVQCATPQEVYRRPVDRQAAAFFTDLNVFEARVVDGAVSTPFGPIPAPHLTDGVAAEVAVRPHDVAVNARSPTDPSHLATARVSRARFLGARILVEARLEAGGALLQAEHISEDGVAAPRPGDEARLSIRPENCHVFAAKP